MKCLKTEYVKFKSVQNPDGTPKINVATPYIDVEGIAEIYMSEKKFPGKTFIYFTAVTDEKHEAYFFDSYFHTSYGDIEETSKQIKITTKNSIYTFEKIKIDNYNNIPC